MTRAIALALIVLGAVLVVAGSTQAITPSPYRALSQSEFRAVPGSAGQLCSSTAERHAGLCAAVEVAGSSPALASSTPPSSPRPTIRPPRTYLSGVATFYAYNSGQAAAAKPLRDELGAGWRGSFVRVCHDGLCLRLRLTAWEASLIPGRLIDLSSQDFRRICGPLSKGVCAVTVVK